MSNLAYYYNEVCELGRDLTWHEMGNWGTTRDGDDVKEFKRNEKFYTKPQTVFVFHISY